VVSSVCQPTWARSQQCLQEATGNPNNYTSITPVSAADSPQASAPDASPSEFARGGIQFAVRAMRSAAQDLPPGVARVLVVRQEGCQGPRRAQVPLPAQRHTHPQPCSICLSCTIYATA